MSGFLIVMVYLTIWWLVLFITLPVGIRRQENGVAGQDSGAPEKAHLGLKLLATTIVTAGVTWLLVLMIEGHWVELTG